MVRNRWLIIAIIVILASGIALTLWTAQREDSQLREELLTKTRLVQSGISTGYVRALTGSDSDLVSSDYSALKEELLKVRSADPLIRFVYIIGRRPDGTVFFLADSEPPGSVDYSPPGQAYPEASAILLNAFVSGMETTEGPLSDRWGTWVSSFVPIRDIGNGPVIALLGIDMDAWDWNLRIIAACGPAIIATLLLLFFVLIFYYVLERNNREKQILAESEAAIRKSEEEFRTVFEKGPLGMAISDERFRFIKINPMFCRMIGYSQEELLTKTFTDITHPDHLAGDISQIKRLGAGEIPEYATEKRYIKKNGEVIWASVVVTVVRDLEGKFLYYLALIADISGRKAIEDEKACYTTQLQQHANVLTEMNDKLNLLNSITRHDILNQLTVLLGYLEIMKIKFHDPALQETVDKEILAAHNIQTQIMFTKDYQDIGVQSPQWFDIRKVIASAVASLPLSQVSPVVHFDKLELYADPLLGKVFYNLMENALRHGKTVTTIDFSCKMLDDSLVVIYQDNGVGIPAGYKEAIFERKFFNHTGFGLFLSRTILGITGMTIRETGEPGRGARFEITVRAGAYRFTNSVLKQK
ncbi:MAG: PAS domain S-box protein [Methanoregula sp.]